MKSLVLSKLPVAKLIFGAEDVWKCNPKVIIDMYGLTIEAVRQNINRGVYQIKPLF